MIRYGIIGSGMMGQEHIRNIALLPDAAVTAFVEPDPGMVARTRALVPQAAHVADIATLLARDDVDALLIASPNHMHIGQLTEVAAIRPLPVLVEKPLYTDEAQLPDLERLMRAYPAPVWVAMEYRYMPPVQMFRDKVADATGGIRMLTIREHRFPFLEKVGDWNRFNRNTGGTLVEKCCHFFDLMRLIIDDEPQRVMASAGQAVNHRDERYDGQTPISGIMAMSSSISPAARAPCWNCACSPKGRATKRKSRLSAPRARSRRWSPAPRVFGMSRLARPQPRR